MAQHTPGPWEAKWNPSGQNGEINWYIVDDTEENIIFHLQEYVGDGANAKLAAAAPDMKDMLKAFIASTEGVFGCGHTRTDAMKLLERIEDEETGA